MNKVFQALNHRLIRFLQKKHKFTSYYRSKRRLRWIVEHFPNLFVHWQYGFTLSMQIGKKKENLMFCYEEPYVEEIRFIVEIIKNL